MGVVVDADGHAGRSRTSGLLRRDVALGLSEHGGALQPSDVRPVVGALPGPRRRRGAAPGHPRRLRQRCAALRPDQPGSQRQRQQHAAPTSCTVGARSATPWCAGGRHRVHGSLHHGRRVRALSAAAAAVPRGGRRLGAGHPAQHGRRDRSRANERRWLSLLPSEYFARQCWISFSPEDPTLATTAAFLGDDRILWATDFPHLDGVYPGAPAQLTETIKSLSPLSQERIAGVNALAAYGIKATHPGLG